MEYTNQHPRPPKLEYAVIDLSSEKEIFTYAKKLEGHTFQEVLDLGITPEGVDRNYKDKKFKGRAGTIIEERYFGYKANSDNRPDFPEAEVELKTTCFDVLKNGKPSAGERLVISMIPFDKPIEEDLMQSHVWEKLKRILLIYYHRDKSVSFFEQKIVKVALFTPPREDLEIIKEDYKLISSLVRNGRGEELSEGLTNYLGACTKGQDAATSIVNQYYPPHTPAKRRAFCLKNSYMKYVLSHYLLDENVNEDSIVKDVDSLVKQGFEGYIESLIHEYVGKTDREIASLLGLNFTRDKAQWSLLTSKMLKLNTTNAQEFKKANINVRTVRLEGKKPNKESLSLRPFEFCDILNEKNWEDSELFNYFESNKFFFVIFSREGSNYVLKGCKFWSMPVSDLNGPLKDCWDHAKKCIKEGVHFEVKPSGKVINNLPHESDNPVAHVRPHATKAAYRLNNGFTKYENLKRDGSVLPNGEIMTKQSFWLNRKYVYEIVKL